MTRRTTLPGDELSRDRRKWRAWSAVLVFSCGFAFGCASPGDDAERGDDDASHCAALREHLIGLQIPDLDAVGDPAVRAELLRALGDELVASCRQSVTASKSPDGPRATQTRPR